MHRAHVNTHTHTNMQSLDNTGRGCLRAPITPVNELVEYLMCALAAKQRHLLFDVPSVAVR